jgi:hypothetical protein
MPRTKRITQKDAAATVAMLDAGRAEPTHDPEVQYPPEIEQARITLVAAGWRVRPPSTRKARTPAAPREYAETSMIRSWLVAATKRLGTQQAVAESLGLKNIGPVAAGARGRPMLLAKFRQHEARYAEFIATAPPAPTKTAPKPKVKAKPRSAGSSPAVVRKPRKAKPASKPRKPARNSGGQARAPKAPTREMGSGPVARMVAPGQ